MSSKHGKTELSFRKKKSSESSANTATISKDVFFAHQTVGGETSIDLNSLIVPSTMSGFSNPTIVEIKSANVKKNQNNLVVISSAKGALQANADYFVATVDKINLNFAAAANEVFTFQLRATEAISEVVSGSTYVCTGTLSAGSVDVPLGQAFKINENSSEQLGEFMVLIDGVQQFRNVNNATAALGEDGNYEEVSGGGAGLTNLVRFNEPFSLIEDVAVTIVSLGPILDSNYTGANQRVESLEGKIDQMIPTLAGLAGVPETDFQATPTNVDLKAFANKLYQACKDIVTNKLAQVNGDAALEASKQDKITIPWKINFLDADITSNATDISSLRYNNLEIGKTYRVSINMKAINGSATTNITAHSDSIGTILRNENKTDGAGNEDRSITGNSTIFIAQDTTLKFSYVEFDSGALIEGSGNYQETWVMLEELPIHTETDKWN